MVFSTVGGLCSGVGGLAGLLVSRSFDQLCEQVELLGTQQPLALRPQFLFYH